MLMTSRPVPVKKAFSYLRSEKLDLIMRNAISKSEVYKRRFRHCAARALMILRNYKGHQKNVGRQQVSSQILMNALMRIDPDFTILKEARREVLEDLMDIRNAEKILLWVDEGKIKVDETSTNVPSPFAFNLVMQGFSDILRIEDRSDFIKRMHAMVMAKISLKKGSANLEMPLSVSDLKTKIQRVDNEQKKLLSQLDNVDISAKEGIVKLIMEGEVTSELMELIREQKTEIKRWPKELSLFLLETLYKHDKENFSYEAEWEEDDLLKEAAQEAEKERLMIDFRNGAKRVGLDPQVQYDIAELIDDPDKEKLRPETVEWMKGLLEGAVPKAWSDRVVRFIKGVLERY